MDTVVFMNTGRPGARLLVYYQFLILLFTSLTVLARRPVREVLFRQVYFNTVESVHRITIVAALTGMVVITQISQAFGYDPELIGKALMWTVIRELGPLITAILLISGSGAAVTAELSSMKINREFDTLRSMGINPLEYLVIPRMASTIISLFLLNAYFQAAAILGGFVLSMAIIDVSFHQHISSILLSVSVFDVGVSVSKSLIFGAAIAAITCSHGCLVEGSITEIPRAIIGSQMRSLFMIFVIDGLFAYFVFL
ncbi:MAG: ABC transporter permease [Nitrospinota bacterium]|nr:ABC transporter permease [Nitrospinota bacterium]